MVLPLPVMKTLLKPLPSACSRCFSSRRAGRLRGQRREGAQSSRTHSWQPSTNYQPVDKGPGSLACAGSRTTAAPYQGCQLSLKPATKGRAQHPAPSDGPPPAAHRSNAGCSRSLTASSWVAPSAASRASRSRGSAVLRLRQAGGKRLSEAEQGAGRLQGEQLAACCGQRVAGGRGTARARQPTLGGRRTSPQGEGPETMLSLTSGACGCPPLHAARPTCPGRAP